MDQDVLINSVVRAINNSDLDRLKNLILSIPGDVVSQALSTQTNYGETPLIHALYRMDIQIVKFLLEDCHVDPMALNKRNNSPLSIAAAIGDINLVKVLIASGAKLNSTKDNEYTLSPLFRACLAGNENIAKFLIELGEDIDRSKCLIVAFDHINVEFIKYLLARGADVNVEYKTGRTPLHACCIQGNVEILKILIEKGADHNAVHFGFTPLEWAALNGSEAIISFYSDKDYYTHEEVCYAYELLGVESVRRRDIPSALRFWNKALNNRSQYEYKPVNSPFLEGFQRSLKQIKNYEELIEDQERVGVLSILILERVHGIEHLLFHHYILPLTGLISILNLEFWNAVLNLTSERSAYTTFHEFHVRFTDKFKSYIQERNYQHTDSSILNVFYNYLNFSIKADYMKSKEASWNHMFDYDLMVILSFMCLCSIKGSVEDFDTEWFHSSIKFFLNSKKFEDESPLNYLLIEGLEWGFPEIILYEMFEIFCKISEVVNLLNHHNEPPLIFALSLEGHDEFINILLKFGAVTDTRNKEGESIRELAIHFERPDICIGPSSLQVLINAIGKKDNLENTEDLPPILKCFMEFH